MDVANVRVLIVALLVIGLASAQVNFSTSWGKRSSSVLPAVPSSSAQGSYLALRQKFHPKKELGADSQHNVLPDSDSGAQTIYEEAEDQRSSGLLPSPCLSLLKVMVLVNQIVEAELQKLEKYDRQQQ
ncbi:putative adipokinetic hormone preprohormone [Daphnia sinensis]|uniref:Adipokinetic hormone preprohormone n=1 Tax=Daphnia sinensis TaxID=1820382 RepID=A0AAD5L296_9CRUS|nr:putative adipokinetic hormone preprohormone [Daphnia sinensis]